ncbi:hypothetical protein KKB28_06460 [bacterium]|nr:hypothetical protein [bacterium]
MKAQWKYPIAYLLMAILVTSAGAMSWPILEDIISSVFAHETSCCCTDCHCNDCGSCKETQDSACQCTPHFQSTSLFLVSSFSLSDPLAFTEHIVLSLHPPIQAPSFSIDRPPIAA